MGAIVHVAITIAAVAFPFIVMPMLWRRMKRTRDQTYHAQEPAARAPAWQETVGTRGDLDIVHTHDPNDDLIGLGDRARHAHWPLNNP